MNFELEKWDGEIIENASKEKIINFLSVLDGKEKNYLIIKKKSISGLKVEMSSFKRIHIYKGTLNNIKQTVHPISRAVCLKIVTEYLEGKRSWDKGLRFIKIEPFEPSLEKEIPLNNRSEEELKDIERKTIVMTIGSIILSVVLSIYMYGKIDNMSTMNPKLFFFIMIGIIGGIIFFIYMIFEVFEIKKEKKRRDN